MRLEELYQRLQQVNITNMILTVDYISIDNFKLSTNNNNFVIENKKEEFFTEYNKFNDFLNRVYTINYGAKLNKSLEEFNKSKQRLK